MSRQLLLRFKCVIYCLYDLALFSNPVFVDYPCREPCHETESAQGETLVQYYGYPQPILHSSCDSTSYSMLFLVCDQGPS